MGLLYKTDKRSAIPRWRNHNLALGSGELSPLGNNRSISPLDFSKNSLTEQIFSWEKFGTISHAADLFSSAYTLGIENEFKNIAEFLFKNQEKISNVLIKQILEVLNGEDKDLLSIDVKIDFFSDEGKQKTINDLSTLRNYLKKEPKNPLAWIELARNHSLLGNLQKSIDCIQTALHVNDTSNRFVLRSASRFFHHLGDNEQAHSIIKKSKNLKLDPWLISSEIAFSSILNRKSTLIKNGKEIIKSQKFSPFHISELASSLATNEFAQGDFKNAKALFKTALLDPNDNSLAQVLWFQEDFPYLNITAEQLKIPLAFEAQTQSFYKEHKYEEAYKSALRWLNDEPYSTRPVRLASYISTIFLNDNTKSVEILKHGLKVNPNDLKLLNSLSYNLLLQNKIEEAEKYFTKFKIENLNSESIDTKIALVATTGLYGFRTNNIELGRQNYLESINFATKQKNDYLSALATANYVREEMIIYKNKHAMSDISKVHSLMAKLMDFSKKLTQDDVLNLTNKTVNEWNSIKEGN
jgi:Flp pilus assembly protein TadD